MSNSSVSRAIAPKPVPQVAAVEYPSLKQASMEVIPGPRSNASTSIPVEPFRVYVCRWICPRLACFVRFVPISVRTMPSLPAAVSFQLSFSASLSHARHASAASLASETGIIVGLHAST
jgi:hypothetical protein